MKFYIGISGCGMMILWYLASCLCISRATASSTVQSNQTNLIQTTPGTQLDNFTRESREIQCLPIRHAFAYAGKGIDGLQVPRRAINGDHLKICSQESTCCTAEMERELPALALQDYDKLLQDHMNRFKTLLVTRTIKFDEFFTDLIRIAKNNLHDMFVKTYGDSYKDNAGIFTELFDDLERYYRGTRGNTVDLQASMNRFFSRLYQKIFIMLNPTQQFDSAQLQCLLKNMDKIRPFGDAAERLSRDVKRSFTEARTFVQALAIARDTARTASEMLPSGICSTALTRMMYCPQCRGIQNLKPCHPYCLATMKSCLGQHIELDNEWNQFVDALLLLADRLRSPMNIETVVAPIDVKISEAIMNLQDNGPTISEQVLKQCGPQRTRRAVRPAPINLTKHTPPMPTTHPVTGLVSLDHLSREIKEKLIPTKNFWSSLPGQMCSDYGKSIKTPLQDDCWNGLTKSKSITASAAEAAARGGKMKSLTEPAASVESTGKSGLINQQILQLRMATARLRQAYNGTDVDVIEPAADSDDELEDHTVETSGATVDIEGSGSGDGAIHEDNSDLEIDEDDEDSEIEGSGSTPTPTIRIIGPGAITLPPLAIVPVIVDVSPRTHPVTIEHEVRRVDPQTTATPDDLHFDTTTTTHRPAIITSPTTRKPEPKRPPAAGGAPLHSSVVLILLSVLLRLLCH